MNTAEAAARLGVDSRTITRYFLRGDFPNSRKLGDGPRAQLAILESDVIAYQAIKNKTGGTAPKQ